MSLHRYHIRCVNGEQLELRDSYFPDLTQALMKTFELNEERSYEEKRVGVIYYVEKSTIPLY